MEGLGFGSVGLVGLPQQLVQHQQEVLLPPRGLLQLRRKWKQRKKNLKSQLKTWALIFLTKFL
uniref:Uncharacterized protein n=1 Tax=Urocitellus parryii TaxID=9999 RepID=A0A8D2HUN8_UROPR